MKGARPLSSAECATIKAALCLRDRALFVLGLRTGFRICELLSLDVADVVDERGSVKNIIRVTRADMKGSHEGRTVPMHAEAKECIEAYLKTRTFKLDEPLFQSNVSGGKGGGRLDQSVFRKQLKKVSSRNRIRESNLISTHSMRKTFAKAIYEASENSLMVTQMALGHSNINDTIKYLNVESEVVFDLIRKLK